MSRPVRKHSDPAVQIEVQNIYRILTALSGSVGSGSKKILTGSATFNGASGREIEIPEQDNTDYFVSISPLLEESGFDRKWEIIQDTDKFTVTSSLTSGKFLWVVIL